MTPKEKAIDLVGDFFINGSPKNSHYTLSKEISKCCAKVAATEILHQYKTLNGRYVYGTYINEKIVFWLNVINEIENV